MDLRAENQYKDGFAQDPRSFIPLYEDSFSDLYRYVARRVDDDAVRHQVVELSFLDAIGQMSTCPKDLNFGTWLYSLAFNRIQEYVKGGVVGPAASFESPIFDGASIVDGVYDDELQMRQQAESFFSALTFEEREILKLKFFEELTDGEVMYVLDLSDGLAVGEDLCCVDLSDEEFARYRLDQGDVLFNRTNSHDLVGRTGVYRLEGSHVFASYLVRLKTDSGVLLPDYLCAFLSAPLGRRQVMRFATRGVSQTNVNASNLRSVLIPLPSIHYQRDVVHRIDELRRARTSLRKRASATRALGAQIASDIWGMKA